MSNSAQFPVLNERKVTGRPCPGEFRHPATTVVLLGALMVSASANTIKGAGQDTANTVNAVQGAGHKVAHAVQ